MKKIIKAFKLPSIFLLLVVLFIACDKEFNTIESDVLDKGNSNFTTNKIDISVLAYNKKLQNLKINDLTSNLLGFYDDPAYGKTSASIIAQLIPSTLSPFFGENTVIDSVVLHIPYYSTLTGELDSKDNAEYSIDSLYGSAKINLSIYQNNYLLRDLNPDLELNEFQDYYSQAESILNGTNNFVLTDNSTINFDEHIGEILYDSIISHNSENIYNYTYTDEDSDGDGELDTDDVETFTPALRLKFKNTEFWKELIIDREDESVLTSLNNFRDYFRGIYIKAESNSDGEGSMALLNTGSSDANITIYYTYDTSTDDDTTVQQVSSEYTLNFTGKILNTFINNYDLVNLEDGDETLGDEKLYLKGTEGSMAVIDLFGNEDSNNNSIPDALEDFRDDFSYIDEDGNREPTRLINEAVLVVYEDDETRNAAADDFHTYDRLYAYDVKNNITTIDYSFDATDNAIDPYNSKFIHLGQRTEIGEDGYGFKIRITEHVKNLLLLDSTNTKLGLVVTNNVNYITNSEILDSEDDDVTQFPSSAIITPRGTILHGSNTDQENRKMKLEIYYTEPNQ